jgi:hypothetical protein
MQTIRMMYQLILGDFCERTRRYSFLVTLLGTLFFGYLVITGKWVIRLGEYRGVYNSDWVGSLMGSASAMMLAFFGFYLVKNTLSRDRSTGVGQILAATQLRSLAYVISKFISNLAVLTLMMVVLTAAAVVMQLLSRVEDGFDLWALVAPFLFVCLPVLVLVAATAVLFESVRWLRGTLGNILYILIVEFAFLNNMLFHNRLLDFGGFGLFIPSMEEAALAAYPGATLGFEIGFIGMVEGATNGTMNLFRWEGIDWSLAMVPLRLLWVGCAVCLAGVATLNFDRFDPARTRIARPSKRSKRSKKTLPADEEAFSKPAATKSWSEIAPAKFRFNFLRMLTAELRLMLKGYHWLWYVVALGLFAVQLAVPYEYARKFALPAAWIWPLALWSGMGSREARFNTSQLMYSSAFPVTRQFPAVWLGGLIVAGLAGSGFLFRTLIGGELEHARMLLIGILFVPTFALALGTISGTRKFFEVTYLLIWYVGPVQGLPALDFLGTTDAAVNGPNPLTYFVISLALGITAVLWRRRQVRAGRS